MTKILYVIINFFAGDVSLNAVIYDDNYSLVNVKVEGKCRSWLTFVLREGVGCF